MPILNTTEPSPYACNYFGLDQNCTDELSMNGKYWNIANKRFEEASLGYYVPLTKDGNNDMVIHKQMFPCPVGRYGVQIQSEITQYWCALCLPNMYQDETAQLSCKDCPAGTFTNLLGSSSTSM